MKNSSVIAGILTAATIFAIVVLTIERSKADAVPAHESKVLAENKIQQCVDEAQIIHEFLVNSNKHPENACNLTLSLSIKFLNKANECADLMGAHAAQFDQTGQGAVFVKEGEERRASMANQIKLMQQKCD